MGEGIAKPGVARDVCAMLRLPLKGVPLHDGRHLPNVTVHLGRPQDSALLEPSTGRFLAKTAARKPREIRADSTGIPQAAIATQVHDQPTDTHVRPEIAMNKLIIASTTTLGLACAGGVSLAQDQTQTTNMQDVLVTGVPASYETYVADLHTGYQLQALVGNTRSHYLQAQRAADRSESLRRQGLAQQPLVSVAIDNSSGPGVARQVQLIDASRNTVAIVNVYCRRAALVGGPHCQLVPQPVHASEPGQRLASTRAGQLQLAQVNVRD